MLTVSNYQRVIGLEAPRIAPFDKSAIAAPP
jgi:hypothetical protein